MTTELLPVKEAEVLRLKLLLKQAILFIESSKCPIYLEGLSEGSDEWFSLVEKVRAWHKSKDELLERIRNITEG